MSRRRLLRWVLAPLAVLGLALTLLGNAEFRAPQIEGQLRTSLEQQLPFSTLEAQNTFLQIVPWRGEVRVRMTQVILRDETMLARPLEIDALQVSLPLTRLMRKDYRPTRAKVSGSRVSLRLPEQAARAIPQPGEAESAEDYWGFVFQSSWLEPLTASLPRQVFKRIDVGDVTIELVDPAGTTSFLEVQIDQAKERTEAQGLRTMDMEGQIISPSGRSSPIGLQASLSASNELDLSLSVGELVPAQFYAMLRFAGLETPERVVTSYSAQASLSLRGQQGLQTANLEIIEIGAADRQNNLRVSGTANDQTQQLAIAAEFSGIRISRIAPWTPVPEYLSAIDLDADGRLDFSWDRQTDVWQGEFVVTSPQGRVSVPAIGLPANSDLPIAIRQMSAEGGFDKSGIWLRDIEMQTGEGNQIGPTLRADFVARTSPVNGRPILTLDLKSAQIGRGDLFYLWPVIAAPKTRTRVENMIKTGAFSNLSFTGIYQLNSGQDTGPRMDVLGQDISADFESGQLSLTAAMPPLTQARGSLQQMGKEMTIDLQSAQFGPAQVTDGSIDLDFRQQNWVDLNFAGDIIGPLGPSLGVLAAGEIGLDALADLPLDTLGGQGQGRMEVALGFSPSTVDEAGIDRETLRLGVDLDVAGLQAPGFLMGQGVQDGALSLRIDENGLSGSGQATLDGVQGAVSLAQTYSLGEPWALTIDVTAPQIPAEKAGQFVPGMEGFLQGMASGTFAYARTMDTPATLEVDLDVANVAVAAPVLAYNKAAGTQGRVAMTLQFNDTGVSRADGVRIDLPDLRARGVVSLGSAGARRLDLSEVSLGRTALTDLSVQDRNDHLWVTIGNGQFDVEPLIDRFKTSSANATQVVRQTGALGFNLERPLVFEGAYFDTLRFGQGEVLRDARLSLVMANDGLRGLNLNALVPSNEPGITGGRLAVNLLRSGAGYGLSLQAENFGASLQALGMGDDTRRGTLRLTGVSDYPLGGGPWELSGIGKDIRLQNVPALVEVAAAISLTGILEQMSGSGLVITDLEFESTLATSSMHVRRLKMAGPSLGLTMAGALNWTSGTMNFRGAVAPFNVVNQVLGEIPVIRELFTGARQEGLFAAQFGIKGSFENPQVEVDPLSIIQPGILRSFIDEIEGQTY